MKSWKDEATGRQVWQLTDATEGAGLDYFRHFRHLTDGRMIVRRNHDGRRILMALDPETGVSEDLKRSGRLLRARASDGTVWTLSRRTGELWRQQMAAGEAECIAALPDDLLSQVADITADGEKLLLVEKFGDENWGRLSELTAAGLWNYIERPRHGKLKSYDVRSGEITTLVETETKCPFHVDPSPIDPGLVRYAEDTLECNGQRMFTVRTDGSDMRVIRPQELGEMITHEFWWPDPKYIGYTYQDRRGDETVREIPWCEYAPVTTHLGIADLNGREVYMSDPLNSYHSHLYVSRSGNFVSGEGTHNNSFVHASAFDWSSTRVEMIPLATIHTPYAKMSGQQVNADFSADDKWLLYNDQIDGVKQICRVRVDL